MLAEASPSRVLRIEEYNNVIIGIDNIDQSKEHNLYVPGGDILMSMYQPDNIDGISYDDTDNVYSFHADQEHRPGWDSPGAALSANSAFILSEASSNGFIAATPNSDNSSSLIFDEAGDFSLRSQSRDNLGTFTGDNIKFILQGDTGNVGIGTTEPTIGSKLDVRGSASVGLYGKWGIRDNNDGTEFVIEHHNGDGWNDADIKMTVNSSGNVGIGTAAPCDAGAGDGTTISGCIMEANGEIKATNIALSSDSRLKTAVTTIPSALEKILSLRGVTFEWKQEEFPERNFTEGTQIGLIAQEVEQVFPELVSQGEYKSVSYANLVSPLIEAIKELHALYQGHADRIAALEEQIQQLQERYEDIEARLTALEAAQ